MILHQYEDTPPCPGMNCGCTDGKSHSKECIAEHTATLARGFFGKWLPIESAPKDGTLVDLWCPTSRERIPDAKWDRGCWRDWGVDGFDNTGWLAINAPCTHYMLRPPPPVTLNK
jgi:hypothetical protein